MGRDFYFFPESNNKYKIEDILKELGCQKLCPNAYFWFEQDKHQSIDGVQIHIWGRNKQTEKYFPKGWKYNFLVYLRTQAHASYYDVKKQNEIIKISRKRLGGFFNGDYGLNRYATIPPSSTSLPIERALSMEYNDTCEKLLQLCWAINDYIKTDKEVFPHYESLNALIPISGETTIFTFLIPAIVSILEKFFREVFIILLTYDLDAQKKLTITKLEVRLGDLDLKHKERIFAETLSFQNLDAINKNYQKWFNLDLFKAISKIKKIGKQRKRINIALQQIINIRHEVIHRREILCNFRKKDLLDYIEVANQCVTLCIQYIEKTKKIKVINCGF